MGQQFCTACGAKLTEGRKFCESCGARIEPVQPGTAAPASQAAVQSFPTDQAPGKKTVFPVKTIAGVVLILVIIAAAVVMILPAIQDAAPAVPAGPAAAVATTVQTPVPTTITAMTTIPTPVPDPFPDAYRIRDLFSFNEGKYASRATVYRYWMNDTYHWHNDKDNKYYTQQPKAGNKYLLIFINIENTGSDGYPFPKSNTIVVHNSGQVYKVDTSHYLPDKAGNRKETPLEIQELETISDYFNFEHVEDYGYSHGTTQDFVYPGQGNAVDGYLIYEVPASLDSRETYVEIVFDGQDRAVWKLA